MIECKKCGVELTRENIAVIKGDLFCKTCRRNEGKCFHAHDQAGFCIKDFNHPGEHEVPFRWPRPKRRRGSDDNGMGVPVIEPPMGFDPSVGNEIEYEEVRDQ